LLIGGNSARLRGLDKRAGLAKQSADLTSGFIDPLTRYRSSCPALPSPQTIQPSPQTLTLNLRFSPANSQQTISQSLSNCYQNKAVLI
jgi:hypothetical protein